jgi:glycosyltransferase involved in cell wall biosynthesis
MRHIFSIGNSNKPPEEDIKDKEVYKLSTDKMISMVTCVYNRADLLDRTLASISVQDHQFPWEIVIVDDGSTDHIDKVVKKWSKTMPIRLFRTFRNEYANVAWAQNCGVKAARGDYILYCSPEVMHHGPTFDKIYKLLDRENSFFFANVYDLNKADNEWLKNNDGWRQDTDILKRFNGRTQLCGPKRNRKLYFLAGWRKKTYIKMGGMNEEFVHVGYEDADFMDRVAVPIKSPSDSICGYHQYHPRTYWCNPAYKDKLKLSENLYKSARLSPGDVANLGRKWGIFPPGSEVDLEFDITYKDIYDNVTIIIKTFERKYKLKQLVESIKLYYPNIRIIIVDDGQEPESIEGTDYIITPFNIGVSLGRNIALSIVRTKYFITLDDDFVFTQYTNLKKWYR